MTTLATTLMVLGVQLILGAAIYAMGSLVATRLARRGQRVDRRSILSWVEARRALTRLLPYSVALGLTGLAVHLSRGLDPAELTVWASPLVFVGLGALPTGGCFLVLRAGFLEAHGHVAAARRQVRLGGLSMLLGILALLILMWVDLLYRPRFRVTIVRDVPGAALLLAAAMLCLGCSAFVALLASLSGKPRPSGTFAGLFYVAGVVATLLAASGAVEHLRPPRAAADPIFVARSSIQARLSPPLVHGERTSRNGLSQPGF